MTDGTERGAITLANWRQAPHSRWSFQNVQELVPSAIISHGRGRREAGPGPGRLGEIRLTDPEGREWPVTELLARRHTDCLVALVDGRVVAEWAAPHAAPDRAHLIFSVSKSLTGLLAGIAAARGLLDADELVTRHVPEVARSAYGSAQVRDLLDMTVEVAFDEDYLDHDGAFDRYRRAMLWNPEPAGARRETMLEFLASLDGTGAPHGRRFRYASPNSDLLGLVVERAFARRFHEVLGELLLSPLGCADPALVTVDRAGTARAAGGIAMSARDLARIGQMVLEGGRGPDGGEIVPAGWISDMRGNGDRLAWVEGEFHDMLPEGRYRSCWYDDGFGALAGIGIHGQFLWIDFQRRVVLARAASRPMASDDPETAADIAMMGGLAAALAG